MLSPKSLDFGQIRIRFVSCLNGGLDPCVFASSQQPGRESTALVRSVMMNAQRGNTPFVHGDVVEVTEPILQTLKGGKELLASSYRPLVREQAGKEFRRIAQLFGLNAQLVSPGCIELRERLAFFPHLAPALRQLLGRVTRYWEVTPVADEIILRISPLPSLQPRRDIECEGTE